MNRLPVDVQNLVWRQVYKNVVLPDIIDETLMYRSYIETCYSIGEGYTSCDKYEKDSPFKITYQHCVFNKCIECKSVMLLISRHLEAMCLLCRCEKNEKIKKIKKIKKIEKIDSRRLQILYSML